MIDDPKYPRETREDIREFEVPSEYSRHSEAVNVVFLLRKLAEIHEEFPDLVSDNLHVSVVPYEYNPLMIGIYFRRPETDSEYSKRIYYAKQSEARKLKRAEEKRKTDEQKAKDKEEKERAELARLKAKYEGIDNETDV
ncbi:hypothetical protein PHIM7_59 [Sinorhizobium phage phiM7]|uniref:Uncharacterized protein n=3 Tax=Emdodecavirus TaxID=1980937 RepID=S5MV24_9CAUD|nr:hypothetical protein AB690_gp066 [Sinorhizobium phage phiM12]YP_009212315.1 hypothetical protein AVT40_gp075 [Sinorhizobium phage phiN3]YP_009601184.1 hypothetical protein FDH46_gp059 [Sinorhizobium phage phiM7]AKF12967.1 hypothetical protein PHIM19_60 [Sinorhizobium phage phiM19]AGR47712.1 hypothetical protein SmphiM12_080 [Sinorhizobium phage phiM12]AKF12607.1 hypothetical protein PHIM7_59 [Sinorhizobium phage phiM7]AKF13340.1 hypothetical protein PHIN3_75 [Sinorhizobium phage phiN3]